jgi:hypothetical protein
VSKHRLVALAAGCAAVLAGCGGGSSDVVRPPTGGTSSTSSAPSTPPPTSSTSSGPRHPTVTVTPARGLHDGQSVKVIGKGFTPDEPLTVIQCADKGQKTGPGDCNLPAMFTVSSDADGRVSATLAVARGPFGANNVVCNAKQSCLISVTQASLNPTEEADAEISFAGS